jgi:hypothetical protein
MKTRVATNSRAGMYIRTSSLHETTVMREPAVAPAAPKHAIVAALG